ncbi:MAG: nicotinate-nucleotide--dimethylbenzimidazole phosphoribosyltransferase [Spirochaetes bacterium]|nr:MAG: nicotinate-nucleotide--dimethylbenzimidazole phosphoribosyltransferase [Spirochaetota bacterium]
MLERFYQNIKPIEDKILRGKIQAHLDDLTKPPGSLGRLEEFALQYCLIRGKADSAINKMKVFTFAADHGITAEKVSPFPKEVTVQMVKNMANVGAAISVLCKNAGIDYTVVDIGVESDAEPAPALLSRKVARGTKNFRREPAMSYEQCEKAIETGYVLAKDYQADLFGIGEMGIGNTSSASALYALLLALEPERAVGQGTGARGELFEHKKRVIAEAVEFHRGEWDGTPLDGLRRVGGLELAGMVGFIFGSATQKVPVVVDGFISSAAALAAVRMAPTVMDYLFFSHISAEKFHREFLSMIGAKPILDLGMRLGEGTGASLAMHIIWQAMNCYNQMATFSSAGVSNA